MKSFFSSILLFLTINLFAQDHYKITYQVYNNTEIPNILNGYLIINTHENATIFKEDYTTRKQAKNEINGQKKVLINPKKGIDHYFIISNDTIQELKLLGNIYVNVIDICEDQNWQISTESKMIGNYKTIKATCNFRGRNWEAWFTPDITFSSGPWKFKGLPGLILQINDESKRYIYNLEKIETSYDPNIINEIKHLSKNNLKTLSVKQFLKEEEEARINTLDNLFKGRGSYIREKAPRKGKELIYEWEEEQNNKLH